MRTRNLTDGVTIDSVSEFIFAPDDVLSILFADNEAGYLDAVIKMLQILGSSDAVLLPEHAMKTEYSERLRVVLKEEDKLATFGSATWPDPNAVQKWLETNWIRLMDAIAANGDLLRGVLSYLRREYHLAFEHRVPGYDPRHYYPSNNSLYVPNPLRNWLIDGVADLTWGRFSRSDAGLWIDAALTVHYRNFRWNWESVGFEYTPAFTRANAAVLPDIDFATDTDLLLIRRCIAAEMIAGVKSRRDLLKCAIEWTRGPQGGLTLTGYSHLRAMFTQADEAERKKHREEMDKILNSQVSGIMDAAFGMVGVVKNLVVGEGPKDSLALSTAPSLRWLWNIRHPSALPAVASRVRELASRP